MNFIIDLIVFIIRELLNQPERKKAAPPRGVSASQPPLQSSQTRSPALAPRTVIAPQDAGDNGERLRLVLTLLGLILLVLIVAAWIMYTQGWLP